MQALRFIAGDVARARIAEHGLTPELVSLVLGASGGPKWLVLQALDEAIFAHWLPAAEQKIDLIGSSIGAWRMAGAAHPEAARKIPEFHEGYFTYRYQKGQSAADITRNTEALLDDWLSDEDCKAIVANPKRVLHITISRSRGLMAQRHPALEGLGLGFAAISNAFSRRAIGLSFERVVLSSTGGPPEPDAWSDFRRSDYPLTAEALKQAIMASCSIPFLVQPVEELPGLPKGRYRDGGFIDYHFDISFKPERGILLYPHFYGHLVPGWFDKGFKHRRAGGDTLSHSLILAPSEGHVASLPFGRIPDRNSFTKMDNEARLAYWRAVTDASQRLADDFERAINNCDWLLSVLEPAP